MSTITPLYGPEYMKTVLPLIHKSQQSIDILTYDWQWYPNNPEYDIQQFNMSVTAAYTRHVKVRAYLQDKNITNFVKSHGIAARLAEGKPTLHAKFLIIDNESVVIGSHNLTHRAMSYNIETSVLITDPDIVMYYTKLFNSLYGL